jgi:hypothetical protein
MQILCYKLVTVACEMLLEFKYEVRESVDL